jgi:hypothetical protein
MHTGGTSYTGDSRDSPVTTDGAGERRPETYHDERGGAGPDPTETQVLQISQPDRRQEHPERGSRHRPRSAHRPKRTPLHQAAASRQTTATQVSSGAIPPLSRTRRRRGQPGRPTAGIVRLRVGSPTARLASARTGHGVGHRPILARSGNEQNLDDSLQQLASPNTSGPLGGPALPATRMDQPRGEVR